MKRGLINLMLAGLMIESDKFKGIGKPKLLEGVSNPYFKHGYSGNTKAQQHWDRNKAKKLRKISTLSRRINR